MLIQGTRGRPRTVSILCAAGVVVAATLAVSGPASGASESTDSATTYLVLYKEKASTAGAGAAVASAGGEVVATYAPIGVVVARSSNPNFAATVKSAKNVEGAVATSRFATRVDSAEVTSDEDVTTNSVPWGDPLSGLQWDMTQIHVPEAHAISAGSRDVLVADLDTGLDFTHPDLAPVYDAANSADCSSGAPQPLLAGNDPNGHGTHTAGTIAAAANGIGIVGVAPNVRLAGIKTSNDEGFFFPEMVVCAYMWAGDHGVDVTNNSYFADPWLFNCKNDPEQRAIWTAERRAIRYAQSKGTVVVASQGNFADDLSHPTRDVTSPDFPPGSEVTREITNACSVVPVEVPGVVGVTATGSLQMKSFYSSYGISTADVAAPGGDSILQVTPQATNGRVLSTYPAANPCARRVVDSGATYCYLQGTSMAAPHATGVAALIASVTGKSGGALAAALQDAVNPIACPADVSAYAPFPGVNSGAPQTCEGTLEQNSWFGAGEVDALKAVS